MSEHDTGAVAPSFAIFRARDAGDLGTGGPMHTSPMGEVAQQGMAAFTDSGGAKVSLLYSRPGMSLTYCWFKSGYPLPLHSHDSDCLYFIVAGSLKIGTEDLGPGDGFFLGSDVPYTYVPGENGVEVMEFRTSDDFDFRVQSDSPSYWDKMVERLSAAKANWPKETTAPSGIVVP